MTKKPASIPPRPVVEAMELHRAGRLDEAERRYAALLPEFARVPDLQFGIGYLALQQGRLDTAAAHLEKARGLRPGHAGTLNALGSALLGLGRAKDAEAQFAQAFRAEPSPVSAEHWAIAARQVGAFKTVVKIFNTASRSGFATPRLQGAAAHAFAALGETDRAAEIIRLAVTSAPNDVEIRHVAGKIESLRVNAGEAVTHLERAVQLSPSTAQLHLDLAWAYIQAERADAAAKALRAAAERAGADGPGRDPVVLRDCAIGLERLNLLDEAERIAERAAIALPRDGLLAAIRSTLRRRDGRLNDAYEVLAPVIKVAPQDHRDIWFEWARVLDGLGKVEEAASALGMANKFWRSRPNTDEWIAAERKAMARRAAEAEKLAPITAQAATADPAALAPLPFKPVFLTGFPRSGTTLTDRVLGAHPAVSILEERPLIEVLLSTVEKKYGPYPGCLLALAENPEDIVGLRDFYARGVEQYGGAPGGVALDKHPMNFWRLGLIRMVFPEAPILVLRRHPLDVVLSCWQQNFFHTPPLSVFASLSDAAETYDQWHRLVEAIVAVLPLDLVDLSYEALAADPEKEIRAILPKLGLEWRDEILRFGEETVDGQVVWSASYAQVGENIHSKAVGRWKRYESQLAGVKGVLAPWCARFGYSV